MAMILAGAALLNYAADKEAKGGELASRAIYESTLEATAAGIRTPDLGGSTTTTQFTNDVIERVATKIDIWESLGPTV